MTNNSAGVLNISGCSLKVSGVPIGFPVLGQEQGTGGTSLGKHPAGSFSFSFLSAKRKHWGLNHIVNCIPHSLFLTATAPGKTNTFFLRSCPPGGPTKEPSGRAGPLLCSRMVLRCVPSMAPSCQPAGCCTGQTCSQKKQVVYIEVSSILNDSVVFLPGCFSCNMHHISF